MFNKSCAIVYPNYKFSFTIWMLGRAHRYLEKLYAARGKKVANGNGRANGNGHLALANGNGNGRLSNGNGNLH